MSRKNLAKIKNNFKLRHYHLMAYNEKDHESYTIYSKMANDLTQQIREQITQKENIPRLHF